MAKRPPIGPPTRSLLLQKSLSRARLAVHHTKGRSGSSLRPAEYVEGPFGFGRQRTANAPGISGSALRKEVLIILGKSRRGLTARQISDEIERRIQHRLTEADRERTSGGTAKWKVALSRQRLQMLKQGEVKRSRSGQWTVKGKAAAKRRRKK